jgi:hypothetical protein
MKGQNKLEWFSFKEGLICVVKAGAYPDEASCCAPPYALLLKPNPQILDSQKNLKRQTLQLILPRLKGAFTLARFRGRFHTKLACLEMKKQNYL